MREMPKEDAVREYGVKYVPELQGLNLSLHEPRHLSPEAALAKKLEDLSAGDFSGHLRLKEEIGAPTEDFYYSDRADIEARYAESQKQHYRDTLDAINEAIMQPENSQLIAAAATDKPEHKRLRTAFEQAYGKTVEIDRFLNGGQPFVLDIQPLNDTVKLPDHIAKAGETVYVVSNDGKSLPSMAEGTVLKAHFHASFFLKKADFSVQYDIDLPNAPVAAKKADEKFVAIDTADDDKTPAGAVARHQHCMVFNSKAAAAAHMDAALTERKRDLVQQLQEIRNLRRKPPTF